MLAAEFGLNSEEIFKKTGINSRRRTTEDLIMSDMAEKAAQDLFKKDPSIQEKIDAIVLVGHGYDYKAPITAAILQNKLGIKKNCLTIDLPHGCTGYINGLAVSKGLIEGGMCEHILLLTGDTPSFVIAKDNAELNSIFSDSATASYITKDPDKNDYQKFMFGTDGAGANSLIVHHSSSREPADVKYLNSNGRPNGTMEMNSTEIFLFAIKVVPQLIKDTLEKNKVNIEDIDHFVFHQANTFLLEVLRKKLKIPSEKFYNNITETGNTVASTIPIALNDLIEKRTLKRGMTVLLAGFGLGYTWGATIIKF